MVRDLIKALPTEGRGLVEAKGSLGLYQAHLLPALWGSSLCGLVLPSFMAENTLLPAL